MITALDDRDSRLRGIEAGADDFISKPFDRKELRARVRTIVRLNRYRRLLWARARFERIIDISPDGIMIVNHEERITMANPAASTMLGADNPESVTGSKILDFIPREEHQRFSEYLKRMTRIGLKKARNIAGNSTIETQFIRLNGVRFPVEMKTGFFSWEETPSKLIDIRDISDRKESELLYRTLTESVADGVMVVQDRRISFSNRAFGVLFDYTDIKDLYEMEVNRLFDNDFTSFLKNVSEKGGSIYGARMRVQCVSRTGRTFWVSTNNSPITWKYKPAILTTLRDVTEEVNRETAFHEEAEHIRKENIKLKSSFRERYRFGNVIGKSPAMQEIYEQILKAALTDANVIVLGESGTGKELVAREIHEQSNRVRNGFITVNCGAIPKNLIESEFFGHRKGAFTGAYIDKKGYLEASDSGTLFLDEVADLGLNLQVKLLRVLDCGEYTPLGDTRVRKSDLRIISATNRNLSSMVAEEQMRQDFYYRISIIPITLPPLRERKEDIPLLAEHFMKLYSANGDQKSIPGKFMDDLYNHDWRGNVRELQNVIRRYLAVEDFSFFTPAGGEFEKSKILKNMIDQDFETIESLQTMVERFEKRYITETLIKNRWHRGKTATILGINPRTLYTKMQKFGLQDSKNK